MLISNMSRKGAAEKKQTCQKPLYISSVYILVGLSLPLLCVFILFFVVLCIYFYLLSFLLARLLFVQVLFFIYLQGGKFWVFLWQVYFGRHGGLVGFIEAHRGK